MVDLTTHEVAALRASGQSIGVSFQIGKNGVNDGVVTELQNHISREPLVKVKFLKSARTDADLPAVAADLAARARVRLIEVRGGTALFYRAPRHKRERGEF